MFADNTILQCKHLVIKLLKLFVVIMRKLTDKLLGCWVEFKSSHIYPEFPSTCLFANFQFPQRRRDGNVSNLL